MFFTYFGQRQVQIQFFDGKFASSRSHTGHDGLSHSSGVLAGQADPHESPHETCPLSLDGSSYSLD